MTIVLTISGLAELIETMNRPDLTRTDPTVTLYDGFFLGKYRI